MTQKPKVAVIGLGNIGTSARKAVLNGLTSYAKVVCLNDKGRKKLTHI